MPEITIEKVRTFLKKWEGQEISLPTLRSELGILQYDGSGKPTKAFDDIRDIVFSLTEQKILRHTKRGVYMVVKQVTPIQVFGVEREDIPPFDLIFPRCFDTMMEMDFAEDVVIREGDLVLISGMSNFGKTTLCLNFCGENIDTKPILMGNEYTIMTDTGYDVAPRFKSRLNIMSNTNGEGWIDWRDNKGNDKFTLLPVWADYAEHIVKNKINIVDWINLPGEYYMISPVMEGIKKALGRGIGIIAIQKNETSTAGRGGSMTRDFADLEILIDRFGNNEVLLTLGKVKEATKGVTGKTYAYSISQGVKIINFREVKKCPACRATGYTKGEKCSMCYGNKFVDR